MLVAEGIVPGQEELRDGVTDIALEGGVGGGGGDHVAVVVVHHHVAELVHAGGLVAVQGAEAAAFGIAVVIGSLSQAAGAQHVDVGGAVDLVGQGADLGIAHGRVDAGGPGEVLVLDDVAVQGELGAEVLGLTHVHEDGAVDERRLRSGVVVQQVRAAAVVQVEASAQAVVEEDEVETDIHGHELLPAQVRIRIGGRAVALHPLTVHKVLAMAAVGRAGHVGTAATAGDTVGDTGLEAVDPAGAPHEVHVRHFPGDGGGGEVTPLVIRTEVGGALVTEGQGSEDGVVPVVVHAAQEGDDLGEGLAGTHARLGRILGPGGTGADVVPQEGIIGEAPVGHVHALGVVVLVGIAGPRVEVVGALVEGVVEQPLELVAPVLAVPQGSGALIAVPVLVVGLDGGVVIGLVVVVVQGVGDRGAEVVDFVLDEVRLQGHGAGGVQALAVRGLVEHRLDRVRSAGRSGRLVVGAVVVVDRERRVDGEGGAEGTVVAILLVHAAGVQADVQLEDVLDEALLHGGAGAEFLTGVHEVHTEGVLVAHGSVVGALVGAAVHAHVMRVSIGEVAQERVVPVRAGAVIGTAAGTDPLFRGQDRDRILDEVHVERAVIGDMGRTGLILGALLRGDEDDAVRAGRTVDGGGSRILQDGHGLDVLRGQGADVAARDAVDHHERAVAGLQGGGAADLVVGTGVRVGTLARDDVQAGHLTGEHRHRVVGGAAEEVLAVHLDDGRGNLLLGQSTVTDDDHFVQEFRVLFEEDPGRDLGGLVNLRGIADAADFHQRIRIRDAKGEITVQVGRGTIRRALLQDGGADDRALRILHHAFDQVSALGGHQTRCDKQEGQCGKNPFHWVGSWLFWVTVVSVPQNYRDSYARPN